MKIKEKGKNKKQKTKYREINSLFIDRTTDRERERRSLGMQWWSL